MSARITRLDTLCPCHARCGLGPVVARRRDRYPDKDETRRPVYAWCTACGDTWDEDDDTLEALRTSEERYDAREVRS